MKQRMPTARCLLFPLDFSNVDGKHLSEVLSTLTAPLERLNALVVVVLSTEQRAQWPNNLVNRFDHADVLSSLAREEVRILCESRIATASKLSWEIPEEALDFVFEKASGSPSKTMRLMRDAVDFERANPREVKYEQPDVEINPINQEENYQEITISEDDNISVDFDLDLEELEKEPEPIYLEATEQPPLPRTGPFSSLVARNRINKQQAPPFEKSKATKTAREPDGVDANKLWIANQPEAMLVQEETTELDLPENDFIEDSIEYPDEPITSQENNDVEGLFGQLLNALNVPTA